MHGGGDTGDHCNISQNSIHRFISNYVTTHRNIKCSTQENRLCTQFIVESYETNCLRRRQSTQLAFLSIFHRTQITLTGTVGLSNEGRSTNEEEGEEGEDGAGHFDYWYYVYMFM